MKYLKGENPLNCADLKVLIYSNDAEFTNLRRENFFSNHND